MSAAPHTAQASFMSGIKKLAGEKGEGGESQGSSTHSSSGGGGNSGPVSNGGSPPGGSHGNGVTAVQIIKQLGLSIALILTAASAWYWNTHDTPPNRAAASQAFMKVQLGDQAVQQKEADVKLARVNLAAKKLDAENRPAPAPAVATTSVITPAVSSGEQAMIAMCGEKFEQVTYEVGPGCFYFNNKNGTTHKVINLWSRTSVTQIVPQFDGKEGIWIIAADGQSCMSYTAETCASWIPEHSIRIGEFIRFNVTIPANQGLIAQFNNN